VSAGATSITVSTASPGGVPVLARDVITFTGSGHFEIAWVACSYTGGTTIALEYPLQFAWTTAAQVSVALDRPVLEGLVIFGLFTGLALWHCTNGTVRDVQALDVFDTAFDVEGGSHNMVLVDCVAETLGKFGAAVDDDPATTLLQLGPNQANTIRNLRTTFAPGGTGQLDGIYAGTCEDLTIEGGFTDLRGGGETGIRKLSSVCKRLMVRGHGVLGPDTVRADTFGFKATNQDSTKPGDTVITGMNIRNVVSGLEIATDRSAVATGNQITNVTGYGINIYAPAGLVQHLTASDNMIDGCVVGIRSGGTCTAGSSVYHRGNIIRNASFTPISVDTGSGWTEVGD